MAIAGALKSVTNVDCPWDLAAFNGTRPYVHIFGDRPDTLPPSRCFPGAHSSSGFALLCLYFAFRERSRRWPGRAVALGLCIGGVFSFAQQARGAHFLSHDLTSAFLAWFVALGVYVRYRASAFTAFAPQRYRTIPSCPAPGRAGTNAGAVPPSRG
ncbi:MAG: phosphatase PAP2 family protein [Gammaproteobacteria bacterium]|nr:phosphatase PAP2 family protein [Gammaproteobacteria bacterium]